MEIGRNVIVEIKWSQKCGWYASLNRRDHYCIGTIIIGDLGGFSPEEGEQWVVTVTGEELVGKQIFKGRLDQIYCEATVPA